MRLQNVLLAVAVCGVIPLAAQVSQPPVFRAGTDLVEVDVVGRYERYLTFGGPYADAAREGITRLKWAATGQ